MSGESRSDSSTNTVLIVLGVIFGVILLIALVCGGLAFLVFRAASGVMATAMAVVADMQQADAAATTFLNDLAGNRIDQAYESTSAAFKQRQTLPEFKALVDKNPSLKRAAFAPHTPVQNQPGGRYTIVIQDNQGDPNNPGMNTCTIHVV